VATNAEGGQPGTPDDQPRFVAMSGPRPPGVLGAHPLRAAPGRAGRHLQLFRPCRGGRTRHVPSAGHPQYRDKQVCLTGDKLRVWTKSTSAESLMGPAQEKWLETSCTAGKRFVDTARPE